MPFASSFIVPYREVGGVPWVLPEELTSEPEQQGGFLGFKTGNILSVGHRNWMPKAWDVTGGATAGYNIVGATPSPGPVSSPSNEMSTEAEDVATAAEWDFSGPAATSTLPDFSIPGTARQIPDWYGLFGPGYYPVTHTTYLDIYPAFWDEANANATGWYWETTFRLFAEFSPFQYQWEGEYYCEQQVRVEVSSRGVPTPGSDPTPGWTPTEGTNVNFLGGGGTSNNSSVDRQFCGQVSVKDDTFKDPEQFWTAQNLYGTSAFPCNLLLHIRRNFLDRTAY